MHPPEGANWPQPAANADFPRYPVSARNAGIEARVIAAVVDSTGRVEYPTISLVKAVPRPEFYEAVCSFLRDATFDWRPHKPVRGFIVMPFEFTLQNAPVSDPLPPAPPLANIRSELAHLAPVQLAEWVQTRPHCR